MRRLLTACVLAAVLATGGVLHAQKPDDPVTQDGTVPDPMCMIYVIFGIPIPSGECLCLMTGWC